MLLLTMRGTPFLYYGDEIGLQEVDLEREDLMDPVGMRFWPDNKGRDGARTPMPWEPGPGAGFGAPGVRPWLPLGDHETQNVANQKDDKSSVLWLTKDLIALRRESDDLTRSAYETLDSDGDVWAFRRGSRTVVALNLSDEPGRLDGVSGAIAISTDRQRDAEKVDGRLEIGPWQGAVLEGR
jgi:alpha-glucosidase